MASNKRPSEDSDEAAPRKKQQLETTSKAVSDFSNRFAWTPEDLEDLSLPPLPKPADPRLENQAFVHLSFTDRENYEKLEWLGDAFLEVISSKFIFSTFGGSELKVGRLSQLRERLVCNRTLGGILRNYGLEKRAKLPYEILEATQPRAKEKRRTQDALTALQKVYGDIFEAYVGAIIVSDAEKGEEIVTKWLKALWARELEVELGKLFRKEDSSNQSTGQPGLNPKVALSKIICCPGVTVEYKDMPAKTKVDKMGHNLFAVGVYFSGWGVQGELLGVGRALKKNEAGSKAAEQVLQNKKLLKLYGDKKQAYLKARDGPSGDE